MCAMYQGVQTVEREHGSSFPLFSMEATNCCCCCYRHTPLLLFSIGVGISLAIALCVILVCMWYIRSSITYIYIQTIDTKQRHHEVFFCCTLFDT